MLADEPFVHWSNEEIGLMLPEHLSALWIWTVVELEDNVAALVLCLEPVTSSHNRRIHSTKMVSLGPSFELSVLHTATNWGGMRGVGISNGILGEHFNTGVTSRCCSTYAASLASDFQLVSSSFRSSA